MTMSEYYAAPEQMEKTTTESITKLPYFLMAGMFES